MSTFLSTLSISALTDDPKRIDERAQSIIEGARNERIAHAESGTRGRGKVNYKRALPFSVGGMEKTETIKERELRERRENCKRAKCPNAEKDASECDGCTGPVFWKDESGREHGRGRACTSCQMNGKGLPVCWAACRGPSEVYATDGKNIVSLGGIEDEESYIGKHIDRDYLLSKSPKGQVTSLTPEVEEAVLTLLRTFADLSHSDLKIMQALLKAKNPRQAAKLLGVTKQAVNQAQNRIAEKKEKLREFLFPNKER